MKQIHMITIVLAALLAGAHAFATGGGAQTAPREQDKKQIMNSQKGLEERNNNASVIIGTGRGTPSDGYGTTEKDIRPQGKKVNEDYSDTDLEEKD